MQTYVFIVKTFKLLREHQPWKLALIFVLTLLQGVMGGFSIVLLIPLLQLLSIGGGGEPEGIALAIQNLAGQAGISLTIGSVLIIYMVILTLSALLQYWKSILDARYQQTFIYTLRRQPLPQDHHGRMADAQQPQQDQPSAGTHQRGAQPGILLLLLSQAADHPDLYRIICQSMQCWYRQSSP